MLDKIPGWVWIAGLIAAYLYWQQQHPSPLIQGPLVDATNKPYGTGNSPRGSPMMPLEDSPGYWGDTILHTPVPDPITYNDGTGMLPLNTLTQKSGPPLAYTQGGNMRGKATLQ